MQSLLTSGAPFHLEATAWVLRRRPGNRGDVWEWDRYLCVFPTVQICELVEG